MTKMPNACNVLFVSDVAAVTNFYRDVANMTVLNQDSQHTVLGLSNFELVIHSMRGEPPVKRNSKGQVVPREDSYIKICLPVQDLAAARTTAKALGGLIKDPKHEWEARGFRACDGHDPEGNVIQIRQSLPNK